MENLDLSCKNINIYGYADTYMCIYTVVHS